MRQLLIILVFLFTQEKTQTVHLLFVGNSLTYTNDLPELVRLEAKSHGIKIKTKLLAYPNYALVDHWNDGELQKLIKSGKYDYVILQQGPSSQQEGKEMLLESGELISRLCEQEGATLVYFMVWPSRLYYHTFDGVINNYSVAAESNDAILCAVGSVWKEHFDETGDFSFYGPDGFHPSLRGSQKAAEVIFEELLNGKKQLKDSAASNRGD